MNSLNDMLRLKHELLEATREVTHMARQLSRSADTSTMEEVGNTLDEAQERLDGIMDAWSALTWELVRKVDDLELTVSRLERTIDGFKFGLPERRAS